MPTDNPWPTQPLPGPLEVYVDWMNLFLAGQRVFDGGPNVTDLLGHLCRLVNGLDRGAQINLYLNVPRFKTYTKYCWFDLVHACRRARVNIVNVPLGAGGQDEVDPWMIEAMSKRNRGARPHISFLFVSADRGFAPMIEEVRRSRPIYLGLPTTPQVPSLARSATAWRRVNPLAWRHIGIYDTFCPDEAPNDYRINHLVETEPEYCRGFALASRCLQVITTQHAFVSYAALRASVATAIQRFAWMPDHERNIELLARALIHYQVVLGRPRDPALTLNLEHRAIQPNSPAQSPLLSTQSQQDRI